MDFPNSQLTRSRPNITLDLTAQELPPTCGFLIGTHLSFFASKIHANGRPGVSIHCSPISSATSLRNNRNDECAAQTAVDIHDGAAASMSLHTPIPCTQLNHVVLHGHTDLSSTAIVALNASNYIHL